MAAVNQAGCGPPVFSSLLFLLLKLPTLCCSIVLLCIVQASERSPSSPAHPHRSPPIESHNDDRFSPEVPLQALRPRRCLRRLLRRPGNASSAPPHRNHQPNVLCPKCLAGVDAAPTALIEAGLLTQLSSDLGYTIHHDGQVHDYTSSVPSPDPPHRGMNNPRAVSSVTERLSDQVYEQAAAGRLVLTLGGDHSIAIGTIAGTARAIKERLGREIAVIWVDAHADINTPETSDSGSIHGMPLAFLTGIAKEEDVSMFGWLGGGGSGSKSAKGSAGANGSGSGGVGVDRLGERVLNGGEGTNAAEGVISTKKLVYIGLRDIDKGEKEILRKYGIRAFSMHDIDRCVYPILPLCARSRGVFADSENRWGIGRVMELALAHIGNDTPIHLSFDVDALDPQWAPSTGTPVRGGLTLREGDFIAESVAETGSLIAMDLVEVNPSLELLGAEETIRAGCSLVRCALGDTLL